MTQNQPLTLASLQEAHTPAAPKAVEYPCDEPGCNVFAYDTEANLAEHVLADHGRKFVTVPNGFGGTTTHRTTPAFTRGSRTATASGATGVVRPASEPAIKFLKALVAKKTPEVSDDYVAEVIAQGSARVSKAIDALKAKPDATVAPTAPQAPAAAPQAVRTNKFATDCHVCGKRVDAEDGTLVKNPGEGRTWLVTHLGSCPTSFPFPEGKYAVDNAEGDLRFYHCFAGQVHVQASDTLHLVPRKAAEAIIAKIALDPKAASQAYGREIGACGRCGRTLTDTKPGGSIEQGIGPVCSGKEW